MRHYFKLKKVKALNTLLLNSYKRAFINKRNDRKKVRKNGKKVGTIASFSSKTCENSKIKEKRRQPQLQLQLQFTGKYTKLTELLLCKLKGKVKFCFFKLKLLNLKIKRKVSSRNLVLSRMNSSVRDPSNSKSPIYDSIVKFHRQIHRANKILVGLVESKAYLPSLEQIKDHI